MNTYTIKPLKWVKSFWDDDMQEWKAAVLDGEYLVTRFKKPTDGPMPWPWGEWRWRRVFSDDIGMSEDCGTAKEGKRLAEEHWLSRITPALEQVAEGERSKA